MKRACLAVLIPVLCGLPAAAQQSAFQSGNGQTSIYLGSDNAATFNFGDTKFLIGHTSRHTKPNYLWGYQLYGQASSGVTTLFNSTPKVPEGGADVILGWYSLAHHNAGNINDTNDDWLVFDVGYGLSSFYTSAVPEPISQAKRYFNRFRAIAAYNDIVTKNVMLAIAAGAERRNNLDDLKKVTFDTILAAAPANTTTSIEQTQQGYLGRYRQYVAAPIYTDLLFVLPPKFKVPGFKSQIAFDAFTRSNVASFDRSADGGLGIFLTKPGAPTKVVGGIAASWNDGKIQVGLVASYNF